MKKKSTFKISTLISLFLIIAVFMQSCEENEIIVINGLITRQELNKRIVMTTTTNTATGINAVFKEMITDSAERAEFCQAYIENAKFFDDNSGYFFIETLDAWMVAHAVKPELIGTNRMNTQDENGKFYVQDMVNLVEYTGYGFVDYYFLNPTTNTVSYKLAFVKSITNADWWIGSGFYGISNPVFYEQQCVNENIVKATVKTTAEGIGGVNDEIFSDSLQLVDFCREFIKHIRFFDNQSGYFFIYDFDANNVAHATQPDLQGQNLYDYQDSHGNYVIRDMIEITKNNDSGFYNYFWNNPTTGNEEAKLAFVKKIPGIDYFIGSGVYLGN
ncbi:MAG: cache domain-containing protein [Bacteroidales bacterium]|nr:cache domain-containing protein [Bacteroidales bacterium]